MENNNIVKYLPQILLAIGAIIGIIAFFVDWYATGDLCMTGQKMIDYKSEGWQMYIPLTILILSIVTLIVSAIQHFNVNVNARTIDVMVVIIGIVILALFVALFVMDFNGGKFGDHAAIGTWLALVVGFIPVIVGIVGYFDVFDKLYYLKKG